MPRPIRTCKKDIPNTGGTIQCPLTGEYQVKMVFDSTEEPGDTEVKLDCYLSDAFDGPPGKTVGSEIVRMNPDTMEVDDEVTVYQKHSGISNAKAYGAPGEGDPSPWSELPTQQSVSRTEQLGKWTNSGEMDYYWFCIAGD